ncbi:MAG: PD-(D/E)XK nuclease family protein, partial [Bacteroidetes bacterium]|nr:PD-(D/E)XK nuclease family protein [Bacteroidota bacterium]
ITLTTFEKEYSKSEMSYGKNLLTLKVALKFINNFLDTEIAIITKAEKNGQPVIIKALEQELETLVTLGTEKIKIKGKADRIDSIGNVIRIVDYKTGLVQNKELKLDNWEDICTESVLAKSFQLLMYAFMYQRMNPNITENIQSGIITFRELSVGLKTVKVNNNELLNDTILNEFELQLKQLLKDIFDPAIPFSQTSELANCEYCSFKGICNRA